MKRINSILIFILSSLPVFAQEKAAAVATGISLLDVTIVLYVMGAVLLLIVAIVLSKAILLLSQEVLEPTIFKTVEPQKMLEWGAYEAQQQSAKKAKPSVINKLLSLRPLEEEKDMLLPHEFDGIAELDNPTPAWFMWLFYATIVFAVAYLLNYHVFNWGKLQDQEYVAEIAQADMEKKAYLAKSADNVDENTVKESKDAAVISAGAAIFKTSCVACHGDKGQGIVGPNLTDPYWLHGAKINDVFKTIKYGVPEKGMIAWEKTFTPKQIAELSNYIKSLNGTNPANPKAPQGVEVK